MSLGQKGPILNNGQIASIDPTKIAFDFDGVVADTMGLFIEMARVIHGIDTLRYEEITNYNLYETLDIDKDIMFDLSCRIIDGPYPMPLRPISGAIGVLRRLAEYQQPLLFITARPHLGPIEAWLYEKMGLDQDRLEIVPTGDYEPKAEELLKRGMTHFVEDRLETCYYLKKKGLYPIILKQPWNRSEHPFTEVTNWQELERLISFDTPEKK